MTSDSQSGDAVLMVGWDGAPYEVISELIQDGELPTLEHLADQGHFGPLGTVPYVMSSCAWSTLLTGKNAGKHGVFDFYSNEFREDTYFREPINSTRRSGPDLGTLLNDRGRNIGQLNVPMTYPVPEVSEFAVGGMISPGVKDDGFVHPQDFLDEYENISDYRIDIGEGKDADRDTFIEEIKQTTESRWEMACYCLEQSDDLDVFFVVFTCPDRLSHYFFQYYDQDHPFRKNESEEALEKYADVIPELYRDLDSRLDSLMDKFASQYGEDFLTCVVSDHGMRSLENIFHVNKWLDQNEYLEFKQEPTESSGDISERLDDRNRYIFGNVNWEETTAYSVGKRGAIYVNLEGREPKGSVPPEEYDTVVESLRQDLECVIDHKAETNVVSSVTSRDEIFEGQYLQDAPDIMLTLDSGYYPFGYAFELEQSNLFSTNDWPEMPFVLGIEDGDGIFLASGPHISSDETTVDLDLKDIAPFLLHYLGHSIPSDMDGTVPQGLFTEDSKREVSEVFVDRQKKNDGGSGGDADDRVKDRLQDLGYL